MVGDLGNNTRIQGRKEGLMEEDLEAGEMFKWSRKLEQGQVEAICRPFVSRLDFILGRPVKGQVSL